MKILKYIEPLWLGTSGKLSIRRFLALVFSFNLIYNITTVIKTMNAGHSIAEVTMLLGIEAGLIAALMSLTTYSNTIAKQIEGITKDL